MRYTIVEYVKISDLLYAFQRAQYDLTVRETIDFIRHYTGTADELVVMTDDDEVFIINIHDKKYEKLNIEIDKTLDEYLKGLIKRISERGYILCEKI